MPDIENQVVKAADLSIEVTADTRPFTDEMARLDDKLKARADKPVEIPVNAVLDTAELDKQLAGLKKDDGRHVEVTADLVRGKEYVDTLAAIDDDKKGLEKPVEIVVGIKPPDTAALDAAEADLTTRVARLKALLSDIPDIAPTLDTTGIDEKDATKLAGVASSIRTFAKAGDVVEVGGKPVSLIDKTIRLNKEGNLPLTTQTSNDLLDVSRGITRLTKTPKSVTRAVTLNATGFDNQAVIDNITKAVAPVERWSKISTTDLKKTLKLTAIGFGPATVARLDTAAAAAARLNKVPDNVSKRLEIELVSTGVDDASVALAKSFAQAAKTLEPLSPVITRHIDATLKMTGVTKDQIDNLSKLGLAASRLEKFSGKPIIIAPKVDTVAVDEAIKQLATMDALLARMAVNAKLLGVLAKGGGSGGSPSSGHGSSNSNVHVNANAPIGPGHGNVSLSDSAPTNVGLIGLATGGYAVYDYAKFQQAVYASIAAQTGRTPQDAGKVADFIQTKLLPMGLTDIPGMTQAYLRTSGAGMSPAVTTAMMTLAAKTSLVTDGGASFAPDAQAMANMYSEYKTQIAPKGSTDKQQIANLTRYWALYHNFQQGSFLPFTQYLADTATAGTIPANLGVGPLEMLDLVTTASKHGFMGSKPGTYSRDVYSHIIDQSKQVQQFNADFDNAFGTDVGKTFTASKLAQPGGLLSEVNALHAVISSPALQARAKTLLGEETRGADGKGPLGLYDYKTTWSKSQHRNITTAREELNDSDLRAMAQGGKAGTLAALKWINAMRGGTLFQMLLGTGYPDFTSFYKMGQATLAGKDYKMGSSTYYADPADTLYAQNFNNSYLQYKRLMGNLKDLSIEIGKDLAPFFNMLATDLIPPLQALSKAAKENPQAVKDIFIAASAMLLYKPIKAMTELPRDIFKLLGLGKTATMNVQAGVVNVIGGAGGIPGAVPAAAIPAGGAVAGGPGFLGRLTTAALKVGFITTAVYLAYSGGYKAMGSGEPIPPPPPGASPAQVAQANKNLEQRNQANPFRDFMDWIGGHHSGNKAASTTSYSDSQMRAYSGYKLTGGKLNLQDWGKEMSAGVLKGADATAFGRQHFALWEKGWKTAAQSHSPSRVMMLHGADLARGLAIGFDAEMAGRHHAGSAIGSLLGVTDNAALADVSHTASLGRMSSSYAQLSTVFRSNQMSAGVSIAKIAFDSFGETLTQLREQIAYFTSILLPAFTRQYQFLEQATKMPGAAQALAKLAAALQHVTTAAKDLMKHWPKNLAIDEKTTKHITTILKTKGTTPGPGAVGNQDVTLTAGYDFSGLDGATADLKRRRAAMQKILTPLCLYGDYDFSAYLLAQIGLAFRMKAMQALVHLPLLTGAYDFAAFDRANADLIQWMKTFESNIHTLHIPVHFDNPSWVGEVLSINMKNVVAQHALSGLEIPVEFKNPSWLAEAAKIGLKDAATNLLLHGLSIPVSWGSAGKAPSGGGGKLTVTVDFPSVQKVNVVDFLGRTATPIPVSGQKFDFHGGNVKFTVTEKPVINVTDKPVIKITDKNSYSETITHGGGTYVQGGSSTKFPSSMKVDVTNATSNPVPVTIVGGLGKGGAGPTPYPTVTLTVDGPFGLHFGATDTLADLKSKIRGVLTSAWNAATKGLSLIGGLMDDITNAWTIPISYTAIGTAVKNTLIQSWNLGVKGFGLFLKGMAPVGKLWDDVTSGIGHFFDLLLGGGKKGAAGAGPGGLGKAPSFDLTKFFHFPQGKDVVAALQGALNWASIHTGGLAAGAASLGASILKGMLGDVTFVGNTIVNDVGQGIMYVATRTGAFGVEATNLGTSLLNALGSTIYNGYNTIAPNFTHLFSTVLAELGNKGNKLGTQMLSALGNLGTMIGHAIFDPAVAYFKGLLITLWNDFFNALSKVPVAGKLAPHPPPPFKSSTYTGSSVNTMMSDYAAQAAARPYANPDNVPGGGTAQVTPLPSTAGAERQPIQIILDGKVIAEHVFNVNVKNQYMRSGFVTASSGVMA